MIQIIACPLLLAAGFFDLKKKIIPNWILLILLILGIANLFVNIIESASMSFVFTALDGILSVSLPLGIIWLMSSGRLIGAGDVKLMAVTGLLFGSYVNLIALVIATFLGLILCIINFAGGKIRDTFPFGLLLIIGVLVSR